MTTISIIGATGLVGREVVQQLIQEKQVHQVKYLGRRSLELTSPKLIEFISPDLEMNESFLASDCLISTLGTTLKITGSKKRFKEIDLDLPLKIAQNFKQKGGEHMVLLSSLGANSHSVFFYPQMKGILEDKIKLLNFKNLNIVRPSLLLGERQEERLLEKYSQKMMKNLNFLLPRYLNHYKAVEAKNVAALIVQLALGNKTQSEVEFLILGE
jgi:uncharacterized protein YbjT (DUF2867 family)